MYELQVVSMWMAEYALISPRPDGPACVYRGHNYHIIVDNYDESTTHFIDFVMERLRVYSYDTDLSRPLTVMQFKLSICNIH